MSSLGDFLDAMVRLRQQKAQVEEYNASQRIAGMEALGKGFGGLLGGLGEGMQTQRYDALANQLKNRAEPPRAMAVDPSLQGAADTTVRPGQIPYDVLPMNQGGPFTGGVKGLAIQNSLDTQALNQFKAETGRQRMIDANLTAAERAEIARQRLEETERHHRELEGARQQAELDKMATGAMSQAAKGYQEKVKNANAYNTGIRSALSSAAGAKTQADWEKAVTVVTGLYQAHSASGFKDLPYPQIPPSPDQKAAATTAATDVSALSPPGWNPLSWANPSAADIAAKQKEAQAMPGAYQYPGPAEYEMQPPPEMYSTNPQDYMPGGAAAPSGPSGQPQQGQGGGGSSAPEGFTVTNSKGQKMVKQGGKWVLVQ